MLVYEYINKNNSLDTSIIIVDKKTKKIIDSVSYNQVLLNREINKKIIKKVTIEIEKNFLHEVTILHTLYIKN